MGVRTEPSLIAAHHKQWVRKEYDGICHLRRNSRTAKKHGTEDGKDFLAVRNDLRRRARPRPLQAGPNNSALACIWSGRSDT